MSCFLKLYNCSLFFCEIFHTDVRETVGDHNKLEDFDQSVSRRHFLTKSDVRNIRVKVEDRIIKRHEDDATSVTMMVAELQQESFNPILIFKPQGEKDQTHSLPIESLVLAIQTQFQQELYKKYVSTIMCIDSTHGTRFKLISIVVVASYGYVNLCCRTICRMVYIRL